MNTQKDIRVVVINPETKTIEEQFISAKNVLQSYYDIIGNGCELVTSIFSFPSECGNYDNTMMCDDEILLRPHHIKAGFRIGNYTFVNSALWVGCDSEGETASTTIDIDQLKEEVSWISQEKALEYQEYTTGTSPMLIHFEA